MLRIGFKDLHLLFLREVRKEGQDYHLFNHVEHLKFLLQDLASLLDIFLASQEGQDIPSHLFTKDYLNDSAHQRVKVIFLGLQGMINLNRIGSAFYLDY